MISTFIFKVTHEINVDFKSTLKLTLITTKQFFTFLNQPWFKKKQFFAFLNQPWFQRQLKLFKMIIFTPSSVSYLWVLKRVWILCSWTILLNNFLERSSSFCEDFQTPILDLFAKKSWCALICSFVKIVSLLMRSYLINKAHFQAHGWWCWTEHLRWWRCDI